MKNEIKNKLEELIGHEFVGTTRTAAMECLKFGVFYKKDREGIERQVGLFSIHIQCPWRITKKDAILVGSDDLVEQADENAEFDENFDWDVQGGNLRDIKLDAFLKSGRHIVESVTADNLGGFELMLNNYVKISIFPTLSSKSEYAEFWRLIDNRSIESIHFVISSTGLIRID